MTTTHAATTRSADAPTGPVTRERLLALGGVALAASGVAGLAGGMAHPIVGERSHSVAAMTAPGGGIAYALLYGGAILLMLGLPPAFAWLAPRIGVLGLVGFALYFVGNALSAQAHLVVEGLVMRDIAGTVPELVPPDDGIVAAPAFALVQLVGGLAFILGMLLVGIVLLVRGTVARWIGAAFVVSALAVLVPVPQIAVVTGLQIELPEAVAVVGLGIAMVRAARGGPRPALGSPGR